MVFSEPKCWSRDGINFRRSIDFTRLEKHEMAGLGELFQDGEFKRLVSCKFIRVVLITIEAPRK